MGKCEYIGYKSYVIRGVVLVAINLMCWANYIA